MTLYPPSTLDANQVLQHAFDEPNQRLRVDAVVNTVIEGDVEVIIHHEEDDILIYGVDQGNVHRAVRTNENGNPAINGIYNATTNTNPSHIGVIAQQRNVAYSDVRQTERPTAKRGTINTDTVSLDVSLHDHSGNEFTATNPLYITIGDAVDEESLNVFDEDAAVVNGVDTTILTYTVPVSKTLFLSRIDVSGENIARFEILINSSVSARKRTYFSGGLNETFDFSLSGKRGLELVAGDIIEVNALHNRPFSGAFEARLQGLLKG